MMRDYEIKELLKLCEAIRGEEGAHEWLKNNGFRELSEFWDAYQDIEISFQ